MSTQHDFLWGTLVHLGTNMWYEEGNRRGGGDCTWKSPASPDLRYDRATWDAYLLRMKKSGVNTIVLDVGDALRYESHPEIAVNGAWSRAEMEEERARLDGLGFEVIPKLNFSTTHDTWMKEYAQMISTPVYYQVCRDLIDEVCAIFRPRYFHLGMDEEVYENQRNYNFIAIRQNELWWHDLYYLVNCVETHGARAMMWSDYARHRPEEFAEKCPKSVVQCVWYYFREFEGVLSPECEIRVRPLTYLAQLGFDLLPSGSVAYFDDNLPLMAEYCKKHLPAERLLGFMQTTWEAVTPEWRAILERGNNALRAAREIYEKE